MQNAVRIRIVVFLFLCLNGTDIRAQFNTDILETPFRPMDTDSANPVKWQFHNLMLLKNNEYFSNTNPGQTFFGYQTEGSLAFRLAARTELRAGLFLQKDFGNTKFSVVQPTLTLYLRNKGWTAAFGTLNGTVGHRMSDLMYDYDRSFYQRVENGTQIVHSTKNGYSEAFTLWQEATYRGASNQEIMILGGSMRHDFRLTGGKREDRRGWYFRFHEQHILRHRGGQVNSPPPGTNIQTLVNTSFSGRLGYTALRTPHKGAMKGQSVPVSITGEFHVLNSFDFSPAPSQPYDNGHAFYWAVRYESRNLELMANYFRGTEFITACGNALFNSMGYNDPYYTEEIRFRPMYGLKAVFHKRLHEKIMFDFRAENWWDQARNKMEYNYGLFFRYDIGGRVNNPRSWFRNRS